MYGSPVVERRAGTYTYNREGLRIALLISSRHLPPRPSERVLTRRAARRDVAQHLAQLAWFVGVRVSLAQPARYPHPPNQVVRVQVRVRVTG